MRVIFLTLFLTEFKSINWFFSYSTKLDKRYKITVFTGNNANAGTDADVTIVMYGTAGKTNECKLDNSKNNFERGQWVYGFIITV